MTLPITVHRELLIEHSLLDRVRSRVLGTRQATAVIDGRSYRCQRGAWATWIPAIGAKYLNAIDGLLLCWHHSAPPRAAALGDAPDGAVFAPYSQDEWRRAYTTPVSRRVAENAVAAQRLSAAGLGPKVEGLCIALRYRDDRAGTSGFTAGYLSEDAWRLPAKTPATEREFLAAGVKLDRLKSAVRQQVNGYVVDLNAAVGVTVVDAESEIAALEARISERLRESGVAG